MTVDAGLRDVRAVLLDMDGTLVDSDAAVERAWRVWARESGVDPAEVLAAAHRRGLRVIGDLVVNHTSDQHPWFQAATSAPTGPYRRYYIWRDPAPDGGPPNNWLSHFGGSAWTLDRRSGQYYLHLFRPEQPDLDWHNPAVAEEVDAIIEHWLARGLDGFRVDTAADTVAVQAGDPASPLRTMRRLLAVRRRLLAHPGLTAPVWATPDEGDVVVYRRGRVTVAVNLGDASAAAPPLDSRVVFDTDDPGACLERSRPAPTRLRPHQALVLTTSTRAGRRDPAGGGAP